MKAAGGVSNSKAALHRLVLVKETLGDEWLTPERFRFGASSLLNDLLMQREDGDRPLRAARGLLEGVMATQETRTRIVWDYAPAPESPDHVRLRDSCGLFIDGDFRDPLDGTRVSRSTRPRRSRSPRWPSPGRRTCAAQSSRPAPRNPTGRG